jgi:hypothetical protein
MPGNTNSYVSNCATADGAALGDDANLDMIVEVPAGSSPHMNWRLWCEGPAQMYVYEAPSYSGGSAVPSYNLDRDDGRTSALVLKQGVTVTTPGTAIINGSWVGSSVAQGSIPASRKGPQDMILKPGTNYLFRITSRGLDQHAEIEMTWFEPGVDPV